MKEIPLSAGKVAIIDDGDAFKINHWFWSFHREGYAVRSEKIDKNKHRAVLMHREIMGLDFGDPRQVDHINRNRLDNRRENLRICERAKNQQNIKMNSRNSTGYRGVSIDKRRKKYIACIHVEGKFKFLGYFDDPIEAAKVYDKVALEYRGEFSSLNFPKQSGVNQ